MKESDERSIVDKIEEVVDKISLEEVDLGGRDVECGGDVVENIVRKYTKIEQLIGVGRGLVSKKIISCLPKSKTYFPINSMVGRLLEGRPLGTLAGQSGIDVYFGSSSLYSPRGDFVIGDCSSLLYERLLIKMAKKAVILVDSCRVLGDFDGVYVPVEILPDSYGYVASILKKRQIDFKLRLINNSHPLYTTQGNLIVDVEFNREFLDNFKEVEGVVTHGFIINDGNVIIEEIEE